MVHVVCLTHVAYTGYSGGGCQINTMPIYSIYSIWAYVVCLTHTAYTGYPGGGSQINTLCAEAK